MVIIKSLSQDIKIKEFKLGAEVIFLDCEERFLLQNTRKDYLITQIQQDIFNVDVGVHTGKFKLDFVNPVKELYFVIQRTGHHG